MRTQRKKVFVFTDLHWSLGRVYRDVASALEDLYEFRFLSWATYTHQEFRTHYQWCDKLLTNLVTYKLLKTGFPDLLNDGQRKCIFVSHGFEEHKQVNIYDTRFTYAMTSDALIPLFPNGLRLYITPNGVDPTQFEFVTRSWTSIRSIGWCGAAHVSWKQEPWAAQIARSCRCDYKTATNLSYEELKTWYHTIDLLLVTAVPNAWQETGPLPPFEAIVSGTPVVGTPVGNFRHVPGPKFTCPEDAISIVQEFQMYPERLERLLNDQYTFVMTHYTYQSVAPFWSMCLQS